MISSAFDLVTIEAKVDSQIESLAMKLKDSSVALDNLLADESNLRSKIEKKKLEMERTDKRFKTLQTVRPGYMDEYERIEADLFTVYDSYITKFRNLAFLEHQLDEHNREEQEIQQETDLTLKVMQDRLREEDLELLRDKEGSSFVRPRGTHFLM